MNEFEPNGKRNREFPEAREFPEIGPYGGNIKRHRITVKSRAAGTVKRIARGVALTAAAGLLVIEGAVFMTDPKGYAGDFSADPGSMSASSIREVIKGASEHIWNDPSVIKVPGCSEEGIRKFTCKICGETKEEPVPAEGHKEKTEADLDPTCTAAGHSGKVVCSVCGEVLKEGKDIPELGHDWWKETILRQPTCTSAGSKEAECKRCGEKKISPVPALGHYDGNGDYRCDRCGALLLSVWIEGQTLYQDSRMAAITYRLSSSVSDLDITGTMDMETMVHSGSSFTVYIFFNETVHETPSYQTFRLDIRSGNKFVMSRNYGFNYSPDMDPSSFSVDDLG